MLSQSTGTGMTNYAAFHGEIEKIAKENEDKKRGWITKDKLKRLAIAAPVAAAGAGLGHGAGQLVRNYALSPRAQEALKGLSASRPWAGKALSALPAVAGGLAAGAGALQAMKNRKMRDFIEGKQEDGGRTDTQ
jgi:hypothetical protein